MQDELFEVEGHCVRPVFDPAMVIEAQADITDELDRIARALHLPFERSRPDLPLCERLDAIASSEPSYANLLRLAVVTDAHRGPRLTALAESPALRAEGERLCGRPIIGCTVRVRASLAAFPEHRHRWHSDVAIDDGSDCARLRVTAWIPLMDAGPDSGGLEIAAGRLAEPRPHTREAGYHISEDKIDAMPRRRPYCEAGSALFLDRFTPHRTLPHDGRGRYALVVWMRA